MIRKVVFSFFVAIIALHSAFAQSGGSSAYSFLNLTITPRSAALGSKVVALDENDIGIAFNNPAHLNPNLNNQLNLSYVGYFADIKYGLLSYSRHFDKVGTFGVGLQHVSYGNFIQADNTGLITGNFSAYDMALNIMYSRSFDSLITVGINIKPIFSHLEQYRSYGVCADVGVAYSSQEHLFSAGIVARNIGTMLKPYKSGTWEPLPFEVVAGLSKKLRHAPFRFILTFQQLQNTNLYYQRQRETSTFFGDNQYDTKSLFEMIGDEFISHVILGIEFTPVKNFYLRGGYNFQRRNELKIEERVSTVGISWGLGVKIKKFWVNYSRATYHLVGASNHFSISTNLDDFFTKSNL